MLTTFDYLSILMSFKIKECKALRRQTSLLTSRISAKQSFLGPLIIENPVSRVWMPHSGVT